jgi:hypothetical protein
MGEYTLCHTTRENAGGEKFSNHGRSKFDFIIRLALQSSLLLRTFDNKVLHAPVDLKDGDWVLDAGTGSGKHPPTSNEESRLTIVILQVHGFKISQNRYPRNPSTLA